MIEKTKEIKKIEEKECEICGVWFTPSRRTQKYCPDCGKHSEHKRIQMERHIHNSIVRCGTGRKPEEFQCTCKRCGKEFTAFGKTREYCSNRCKEADAIDATVCTTCGKKMRDTSDQRYVIGYPITSWFCSEECKVAHDWYIARRDGEVKTCLNCGKEFIGKNTTFCSVDCHRSYVKEHGQMKPVNSERQIVITKQICPICGKEFDYEGEPLYHNPVCSEACREKEREQRKAKRKQAAEAARKVKEQAYIRENGLCGICRTSYKGCERMSSGYTASPEGACFSGSLVIKCPKFTAPKKFPV